MPGCYFAHVQDDVTPHILHMLEGTFSFNTAKLLALLDEQNYSRLSVVLQSVFPFLFK